jgi:hypothetical protein
MRNYPILVYLWLGPKELVVFDGFLAFSSPGFRIWIT